MDLLPYTLQRFHPTELNGYEFYAVLKAAGTEDPAPGIEAARAHLATWQAEDDFAAAHRSPEVEALRGENRALREALDTMQRSTLWRATRPLRKIVDAVRAR